MLKPMNNMVVWERLDLSSIQTILRHHNPATTARCTKSLGVQPDNTDAVFSNKKRGAKANSFSTSK
ncbi:MAG: hypothetical protein K5657_10035 [Desulfovibrio sp.]|nr:hypothetical protein [Desulfovibrio sp.]